MVDKYNSYSSHKPTNYIWIDEIPESWSLVELKRYSHVVGGYAFNSDSFVDAGTAVIRIGDIKKDGSVSLAACKYISSKTVNSFNQYAVNRGDLLMAMTGATIGKAGWYTSHEPALLNQRVGAFRYDQKNLNYRFYWYVLNSLGYQEYIQLTAFGGAQPNISDSGMVGYKTALPKLIEQQQIANFLDHETAKIDTLIDKQQQLIKLLKEKRQAVISHAVTKGLNPNAPMKDSGVEWLGEVPEHWDIKRLRFAGLCQNGINIGAEYFGTGFPFVSYGDVYNNKTLPKSGSGLVQSSEADRKNYSVVSGDIFFTRTSETIEEIGFSSVCFHTIKDAVFAGFLIRFRPSYGKLYSGFSKYYFQNISLRSFFVKEMNLVTRASLSQDLLKKMTILLPSEYEQKAIAQYLDKKCGTIDLLIQKALFSIELAKERRTALISAAVTGKIDVRNFKAGDTHVA
ncbi:restriction endonuclease subunit S [Neptunomonas phycophila]|uniref:restriction endonuclease subunit S n=1 Tax=Neptunomonas phycophila TaxID=1572645 RepID=UPI000948A5C3|nr:restriction endonuclease subunit S [Neptunomonas phycophila]